MVLVLIKSKQNVELLASYLRKDQAIVSLFQIIIPFIGYDLVALVKCDDLTTKYQLISMAQSIIRAKISSNLYNDATYIGIKVLK
jgi:hypothetical protein